ncbi:MAG TPA: type IV secretory system conjugative DNA transfer family protein [Candidatus Binatia bacterium]|nr:type IV secretory system conjugative DNA transfer family protein [Candidatus Binatia bacterium]
MPQISIGSVDVTALLANPLVLLGLAAAGVLLVLWIVIAILRAKARKKYQSDVAFKKDVMLVTVPKEQAEKGESGQQEKSLQQVQEKIAIMEGVFASIGGLKAERGAKAWYVGREDAVSFELVAQQGLVSFYVAVPHHMKEFVEQQIHGQFPLAQIEDVPDYNIFSPQGQVVATRLICKRQHFFPIKTYKKAEADPLNPLTNALAKVEKTDGAALQIVVRSAKKEWRQLGLKVVKGMNEGKTLNEAMSGEGFFGFLSSMFVTKKKDDKKEPRKMSALEEEMVKAIDEKASKLGLDVVIRVVASAPTTAAANSYMNNIVNAFQQYTIPQYGNQFSKGDGGAKVIKDFIFRHFSENNRIVMTGEELSSIYHFPLSSTETPNIRWLTSRKAPPPTNIPKEGLFLGNIEYRGENTPVFVKQEDRFRHQYIIGKSGSGKSVFIANLAVQDIKRGDGVCVVDPHGDLVEDILACVPKERADDVIIFDPSDLERPIALNMLESPNEEMKDFVCGEMIAIFYKLFPPEMIGPMFEHNMRNFMLTLMADPEVPGTIAEIPRLISDAAFQKEWRAKVKDPVVRSFWENEIDKTSDFHKSEMLGYLISKVGRFVENTMMRNIIGQQKSAFDFSEIMNKKKIFLVNLSKGKIGDINANLLGLIIVTKLQMAAMSRANMSKAERADFFLYIDEFQNFITPSIATILSEARKYRLALIVAHQYMAQLAPKGDSEIRDAVLGNVGSMFVGRIGIEDAELLEKEFAPVFTAFDFVNAPQFSYFSKILIDNVGSRPFVLKAPPPVKGDKRIGEALKQLSRLKYGRDRSIVEQEILDRTQLVKSAVAAPPERPK